MRIIYSFKVTLCLKCIFLFFKGVALKTITPFQQLRTLIGLWLTTKSCASLFIKKGNYLLIQYSSRSIDTHLSPKVLLLISKEQATSKSSLFVDNKLNYYLWILDILTL